MSVPMTGSVPKTGPDSEPEAREKPTPEEAEAKAVELQGSVKEAIGKLIGDGKVEAEGRAQQSPAKSEARPRARSKP